MKQIFISISILLLLASCKNEKKTIVSTFFVDSLISNYTQPPVIKTTETNLDFWKNRINPQNPGLVNELKYAGTLTQYFHLTGNIQDVIKADSILYISDRAFNHKETAPNMALVRNSILQHRFKNADSILENTKPYGLKIYESAVATFDVAFELGNYLLAGSVLKKIADYKDYGYNFRMAKMAHYNGEVDSAIAAMHRTVSLAEDNIYLKQAGLSNEADLHLHNSDLQGAYDLYIQSVRLSAADLHSIMGIGWIALVHDKNDMLAEKIFRFVQTKTKAPDPLYKLVSVADQRGDSLMEKKYADEFVAQVTEPVYGNMYNKYLIELYTGILHEPAKAVELAKKEISSRATPQTYAWYVWTLCCTGNFAEAEKNYKDHVSGKPLEGLELYWMGKYMKAQNKGFNAQQFFKAAHRNRYDLSPAMVKDLENSLEE